MTSFYVGWSKVYSFQTFTNDFNSYANLQQSFLLIGDMGFDPEAPDTIARLKAIGTSSKISPWKYDMSINFAFILATSHTANVLIHNGDISYA